MGLTDGGAGGKTPLARESGAEGEREGGPGLGFVVRVPCNGFPWDSWGPGVGVGVEELKCGVPMEIAPEEQSWWQEGKREVHCREASGALWKRLRQRPSTWADGGKEGRRCPSGARVGEGHACLPACLRRFRRRGLLCNCLPKVERLSWGSGGSPGVALLG